MLLGAGSKSGAKREIFKSSRLEAFRERFCIVYILTYFHGFISKNMYDVELAIEYMD